MKSGRKGVSELNTTSSNSGPASSKPRIPDVQRSNLVPHWYMYPPKSSYSDCEPIAYESLPTPKSDASFYIHIPFCNMKCSFCSLYTSAGYSDPAVDLYVGNLLREIRDAVRFFPHVRSSIVYFGGGTPALLPLPHLHRVMGELNPILSSTIASRSVEFSPDVVTSDIVHGWKDEGFGRVSLGVQSFNDERLKVMKRLHDGAQASKAIEVIARSGIEVINVDLIFGGHGQTLPEWRSDLDAVLASGADSCTFHPLALLPKTAFERKIDKADAGSDNMFDLHAEAINIFNAAGWKRTSAISFSRSGKPNPLERAEADGIDTFGFGAGARSYLENLHFSTLPSSRRLGFGEVLKAYYRAVDCGLKPAMSAVVLCEEEVSRRELILNLHHGDIRANLMDRVARLEDGAHNLSDLSDLLERAGISPDGPSYRVPDSVLPVLASVGMRFASAEVRSRILAMSNSTLV